MEGAVPLTLEQNVGYVQAEDVYIVYSEYYGGGTIYGRQTLQMPTGEPVTGFGKTKTELVGLGVVVVGDQSGATCGDLVVVPVEGEYSLPVPEPLKVYTVKVFLKDFSVQYMNVVGVEVSTADGVVYTTN
jgi:hypothetical protein